MSRYVFLLVVYLIGAISVNAQVWASKQNAMGYTLTNSGGIVHKDAAAASVTLTDLNRATSTLNWSRVSKSGAVPGDVGVAAGTAAGTFAAGDDSRITGAGQQGGDNTWTGTNTASGTIQVTGTLNAGVLSVPANTAFVYMGDSITAGADLSDPTTERFSRLVCNDPVFMGKVTEYNLGVSGASIAAIGSQTASIPAIVSAHSKTFVFICAGKNNNAQSASTISAQVLALASTVSALVGSSSNVFLATIPTLAQGELWDANDLIKNNGTYQVIDYNAALMNSGTNSGLYYNGYHPTALGHRLIAKAIIGAVVNPNANAWKRTFLTQTDLIKFPFSGVIGNSQMYNYNDGYFFNAAALSNSSGIMASVTTTQSSSVLDGSFAPTLTLINANQHGSNHSNWTTLALATPNQYGHAMGAAGIGSYVIDQTVVYPSSWAAIMTASGASGLQPSVWVSPGGNVIVSRTNSVPTDSGHALQAPSLKIGTTQGNPFAPIEIAGATKFSGDPSYGGSYYTSNVPTSGAMVQAISGGVWGGASGGGSSLAIIGTQTNSDSWRNTVTLELINNFFSTATDSTSWGLGFSKQTNNSGISNVIRLGAIWMESVSTADHGTGVLHINVASATGSYALTSNDMAQFRGDTQHIIMGKELFGVADDGVNMYQLYGGDLALKNGGIKANGNSTITGSATITGSVSATTYSGAAITVTDSAILTGTVSLKGYVVDSFAASLMTATNSADMASKLGVVQQGSPATVSTLTVSGTARMNIASSSAMISTYGTIQSATLSSVYPLIDGYVRFHLNGIFDQLSADTISAPVGSFSTLTTSRATLSGSTILRTSTPTVNRPYFMLHISEHTAPYYGFAASVSSENNPTNWTALGGSTASIVLGANDNSIRDPSMMYDANAMVWRMCYTSGAFGDTTHFSTATSSNKLQWYFDREVSVAAVSGVDRVWAPEWFKDDDGSISIFFACRAGGQFKFYEVHTTDFITYSSPVAVGVSNQSTNDVVDPFMVKRGSTYYLFSGTHGAPGIFYMTSSSKTTGYDYAAKVSVINGTYEGESLVPLPGDRYRMFFNNTGYAMYMDSTATFSGWSTPKNLKWNTASGGLINHGTALICDLDLNDWLPFFTDVPSHDNAFTGDNVFTGNNTHSGTETFSGTLKVSGQLKFASTTGKKFDLYSDGVTPYSIWLDPWTYIFAADNNASFRFYTSATASTYAGTLNAVIDNTGITASNGDLKVGAAGKGVVLASGAKILSGSGSPENAVIAPVGTLYLRSDGGTGTTLYVKESGAGNTGWVAK